MQEMGFDVDLLPVTKEGLVDIEELKKLLREDTILVSVCSVDSEIGLVQPIEEIGELLKNYPNTYFHTDATGAIGKIDISYDGVDFLTFAPHKFYGLNGIGVLINFNDIKITPLIHGGKSTTIYRGGTPVTASIIATSIALQEATKKLDNNIKYISNLKNELINKLKEIKKIHINTPTNSIPNIVNFSLNNADEIVKKLSDKKIYVSTKTACSSKNAPSKSVLAVTKDLNLAKNSIRVSLSHLTKEELLCENSKHSRSVVRKYIMRNNLIPYKCSCCGNIKKDLKLKERTYTCNECGNTIDRDLNASINLANYKLV